MQLTPERKQKMFDLFVSIYQEHETDTLYSSKLIVAIARHSKCSIDAALKAYNIGVAEKVLWHKGQGMVFLDVQYVQNLNEK